MPRWTVDAPMSLDFDDVTALHVHLISGTVAVLATDDRPSLVVSEIEGRPLQVSHSGGTLKIGYEALSWENLLEWLKPHHDRAAVTITVPADCPIQLGVISASAVVSGLSSGASVKGVSGDITLDGVTGDVTAENISGVVEARDIDGAVRFKSVSGELTLAGGALSRLRAESLSGQVTADVTLNEAGGIQVSTVSGDVRLRLPGDTDAAVRLNSTSGQVRGDFESLWTANAPASHTVSGNVGAGTGQVSVKTVSGSITLLRHPGRGTPSDAKTPRPAEGMESETR